MEYACQTGRYKTSQDILQKYDVWKNYVDDLNELNSLTDVNTYVKTYYSQNTNNLFNWHYKDPSYLGYFRYIFKDDPELYNNIINTRNFEIAYQVALYINNPEIFMSYRQTLMDDRDLLNYFKKWYIEYPENLEPKFILENGDTLQFKYLFLDFFYYIQDNDIISRYPFPTTTYNIIKQRIGSLDHKHTQSDFATEIIDQEFSLILCWIENSLFEENKKILYNVVYTILVNNPWFGQQGDIYSIYGELPINYSFSNKLLNILGNTGTEKLISLYRQISPVSTRNQIKTKREEPQEPYEQSTNIKKRRNQEEMEIMYY